MFLSKIDFAPSFGETNFPLSLVGPGFCAVCFDVVDGPVAVWDEEEPDTLPVATVWDEEHGALSFAAVLDEKPGALSVAAVLDEEPGALSVAAVLDEEPGALSVAADLNEEEPDASFKEVDEHVA